MARGNRRNVRGLDDALDREIGDRGSDRDRVLGLPRRGISLIRKTVSAATQRRFRAALPLRGWRPFCCLGHGRSARLQVQDFTETVTDSSRRQSDAGRTLSAVNLPAQGVNRNAAQLRSLLFGNNSLKVHPVRPAGRLRRRVSFHCGWLSFGKNAERRVDAQKDAPNPSRLSV